MKKKLREMAIDAGVDPQMIDRIGAGVSNVGTRSRSMIIDRLDIIAIDPEERQVLARWFDSYRKESDLQELMEPANMDLARKLGIWP